jgi:hypothetical protein
MRERPRLSLLAALAVASGLTGMSPFPSRQGLLLRPIPLSMDPPMTDAEVIADRIAAIKERLRLQDEDFMRDGPPHPVIPSDYLGPPERDPPASDGTIIGGRLTTIKERLRRQDIELERKALPEPDPDGADRIGP